MLVGGNVGLRIWSKRLRKKLTVKSLKAASRSMARFITELTPKISVVIWTRSSLEITSTMKGGMYTPPASEGKIVVADTGPRKGLLLDSNIS